MKNSGKVQSKINEIYQEANILFKGLDKVFSVHELGVIFSRAVLNCSYGERNYKQQMLDNIREYSEYNAPDDLSKFEKTTIKKVEATNEIVVQILVHKMMYLYEYFNDKMKECPVEDKLSELFSVTDNVLLNVFIIENEPITNQVMSGIESVITDLVDFQVAVRLEEKQHCAYEIIEHINCSNIEGLMTSMTIFDKNISKKCCKECAQKIELPLELDAVQTMDKIAHIVLQIMEPLLIINRIRDKFTYSSSYYNTTKAVKNIEKSICNLDNLKIEYCYKENNVFYVSFVDKYVVQKKVVLILQIEYKAKMELDRSIHYVGYITQHHVDLEAV